MTTAEHYTKPEALLSAGPVPFPRVQAREASTGNPTHPVIKPQDVAPEGTGNCTLISQTVEIRKLS